MNWKPLWEAVKEPLRFLVLAVLPFLVSYFAGLPYLWAVVVAFMLRALDKYLHEANKVLPASKQNKGLLGLKGLTGF